ncbi:MAG: hypothetical protein QW803_12690 [Candidatus Methanomethylicia archaeon]
MCLQVRKAVFKVDLIVFVLAVLILFAMFRYGLVFGFAMMDFIQQYVKTVILLILDTIAFILVGIYMKLKIGAS